MTPTPPSPASPVRLEICLDTPAGLRAAIAGGADRIELCAALPEGGLTPSPGLMHLAAQAPCPVRAMIRPRSGGFVYTADEMDVMRHDIDAVREAGLAGVVIGASRPDGRLDDTVLRVLCAHAAGLDLALHRAVDLAVELGFHTLLSSGGARRAEAGLERLAVMVAHAGDRIEIMPGGGISVANAHRILSITGAHWLHASASREISATAPEISLGLLTPGARDTDADTVRCLKDHLRAFAPAAPLPHSS
ncbi:copper homeostasis protein CutC [Asticcacaulis sp. AND118]|uniref:copper homeostasis protein CutC n=1 Tax=Asticcacaulis sp. AND118 TaxID=2840468 RepID=UPI00351CCDA6